MSGLVRASDGALEYAEHDFGTDDLEIDVEATPATIGSYSGFRASTNSIVPPKVLLDQIVPFPHPYKVNHLQAVTTGFCATLIFTLLWYPMYLGSRNDSLDILGLLGSFVYPRVDWVAHVIGLVIHLAIGIGIALSYAYGMMFLRAQSHAGKGAIFGAGLFIIMSVWALPWVTPMAQWIGEAHMHFDMPDPLLNWLGPGDSGWEGFCLGLFANVMFGVILGGIYRHRLVDPTVGI